MKRIEPIFIGLVFIFLLGGCMLREIDEKDLIGEYRAELPKGAIENLKLMDGGQCHQTIIISGSERFETDARWEFDKKAKRIFFTGTRRALTPTQLLNPELASPPSKIVLGTDVLRTATGSIKIFLGEGTYYRKTN
jgi:hypothetical protein